MSKKRKKATRRRTTRPSDFSFHTLPQLPPRAPTSAGVVVGGKPTVSERNMTVLLDNMDKTQAFAEEVLNQSRTVSDRLDGCEPEAAGATPVQPNSPSFVEAAHDKLERLHRTLGAISYQNGRALRRSA